MNNYKHIYIILYSIALAINLVRENESKMHKFYTNQGNDEFMQMVQFEDGNQFGAAATMYMQTDNTPNTRMLSSEYYESEQIGQMSSKVSEMCCKQDGMVVMVGVNPSYFDNNATSDANSETAFYMSKLQEKVQNTQACDCVQNMKFNPNVGVVNVKFNSNSTYEQVNEVMNTMWSEENKVWFMEFDKPIEFRPNTIDKNYVEGLKFNNARKLQASTIPDPHPFFVSSCPNPDFGGPYDYAAPNDPLFPSQWAMENANDYDVDATSFWNATPATTSTTAVAVIDTGLDTTISDFDGQLWENPGEIPNNGVDDDGNGFVDDYNGFNFHYMTSEIVDFGVHGTGCCSAMASGHNNGVGVTGMSTTVKIVAMPTRYISDLSAAIDYTVAQGFKVSSNSWGTGFIHYLSVYSAIKAATDSGQLYITAVNNGASDANTYFDFPVVYNFPNMFNIGSHDSRGYVSYFSDYGAPYVHAYAPGECVITAYDNTPEHGERYEYVNGTSYATPLVAGLAGDLFTFFPDLTAQQVKQAIMDGCVSTGKFNTQHAVCGGIVNAYNAYQEASKYATAQPTTA